MNPTDAIVLAMAAAAAARFRPNAFYQERPEEQAYLALRHYLAEYYPSVPADILDIGPGSAERQAALKAALQQSGAADDPLVRQGAAHVARLVASEDPAAATAVFSQPESLHEAAQIAV
jgi:hypothetical protein